jgi:hypothetical protein
MHLVMFSQDFVAVDRVISIQMGPLIEAVNSTNHDRYLLLCGGCGQVLADSKPALR